MLRRLPPNSVSTMEKRMSQNGHDWSKKLDEFFIFISFVLFSIPFIRQAPKNQPITSDGFDYLSWHQSFSYFFLALLLLLSQRHDERKYSHQLIAIDYECTHCLRTFSPIRLPLFCFHQNQLILFVSLTKYMKETCPIQENWHCWLPFISCLSRKQFFLIDSMWSKRRPREKNNNNNNANSGKCQQQPKWRRKEPTWCESH